MNPWKKYFATAGALVTLGVSAFAQVQVRFEPRHHNVLENSWVRVLDVNIPPGDTTLYHQHTTPSVIVMLTSRKIGSQLLGEKPVASVTVTGNIRYASYQESPITHRVWNEDTGLYHVMDIELTGKPAGEVQMPILLAPMKLLFRQREVTAYSIVIAKSERIQQQPSSQPMLMISTAGTAIITVQGTSQPVQLTTGKFLWIDPSKKFNLEGLTEKTAELVLLVFSQ